VIRSRRTNAPGPITAPEAFLSQQAQKTHLTRSSPQGAQRTQIVSGGRTHLAHARESHAGDPVDQSRRRHRRVVVKINGKEATADARGPAATSDADKLQLQVDLREDPRLQPGKPNVIEVVAYNAEGYLRSRGHRVLYTPPEQEAQPPTQVWAIIFGISKYAGDALKLRYAAKDAEDVAKAIGIAGGRLFGQERTHIALLTTSPDAKFPRTRANLVREFEAVARRAKSGDAVSYETSRCRQGLLTYSLLFGTRGAALQESQFVDVLRLFGFARDLVPQLAQGIGGIQKPVIASPKGGNSFDIGQLATQDKAQIPFQAAQPVVLPTSLHNEDGYRDALGLAKSVDEGLRDASARGGPSALVFVDAEGVPDACQLFGQYRIQNKQVTVNINLFKGETKVGSFSVTGDTSDLDTVAKRIVEETQRRLPAPSGG